MEIHAIFSLFHCETLIVVKQKVQFVFVVESMHFLSRNFRCKRSWWQCFCKKTPLFLIQINVAFLSLSFCHLDRANSIKNNWQTCNLQTCQSIKQFRLNLPHPNVKKFSRSNGKTFSHLQMDIFCHFDFCHTLRNGFWSTIEKCLNNVQLHIIYALFVTKFEMQKEQTR